MSSSGVPWRLELFFKSTAELQSKVIPFIRDHGIRRVNITNKGTDDPLMEWCQTILLAVPTADVCVHHSLKWNYIKDANQSFQKLSSFCSAAAELKNASILLISGGGKKRKLDTVQVRRTTCLQ